MRKNKIFMAIALGVVGAIIAAVLSVVIGPDRVKDPDRIAWCEAADSALHADIKEDLEVFIEDKYDVSVNKVVFKMQVQSYAYREYTLDVWYRTDDGVWYSQSLDGFWDIPVEIEEKLIEQVMFG